VLDKFMKQMTGFVAAASDRADKFDGMSSRARTQGDEATANRMKGRADAERVRVDKAKATIAKRK